MTFDTATAALPEAQPPDARSVLRQHALFCNVQGHYAAGQHIIFHVTKA